MRKRITHAAQNCFYAYVFFFGLAAAAALRPKLRIVDGDPIGYRAIESQDAEAMLTTGIPVGMAPPNDEGWKFFDALDKEAWACDPSAMNEDDLHERNTL